MATRMQQRRGTAAQWVSTNNGDGPILEAGEIGFETDTGKFKIGDGVNHWVDLDYFLDESDIAGVTGDYVLANSLGQANGVATLDADAKLTASQLPGIEELAQDAVDMALVAGTGISKTYNDNANTITIAVDTTVIATKAELAEVSQDSINDALIAGTGITKSYDDNANTITVAVDTTAIQAKVANVSDTEIGYLANVTSDIQTQLNSKASTTDLSNHESDTSNIHGIADTAELATKEFAANLLVNATKTNITITGDKSGLTITAENGVADSTTDNLSEGSTNQYFTNARARAAVDGGTGLDYNSSTGVFDIDSTVTTNTGNQTLTNKNIDLANNTVSGTVSQFNTALSDANFVTTTDTGTVTSTMIADETIVNADISNTAAIAQSKIENLTTDLASKAALAGATFTGNVIVEQNLQIDGNFTVNGSNVLVSATQIQIEDNLLQIAHENPNNIVDLGLVTGYNDGSAKHAGLVKDASDGGKWKLFKGVTTEPSTTVDFTQATLDDLAVGSLEATSLTVGDVSNTEFGYLANVTSDIQSQIDGKISASSTDTLLNKTINLANNTVSGTVGEFNTALSDANFVTTTDTGTVTSTMIADGTIVNGDISASAAIDQSKIANLATDLGNKQDKVSGVSNTEIGYLDGVTSNVQAQIDGKQSVVSGVSSTEIGYLDGVTSGIQSQLDSKAVYPVLSSGMFNGEAFFTVPGSGTISCEFADPQPGPPYRDFTITLTGSNFIADPVAFFNSNLPSSENFTVSDGNRTGVFLKTGNAVNVSSSGSEISFVVSCIHVSGDQFLDALPNIPAASWDWESASATNNAGKYLTNDGTNVSWGTVSEYSAPTIGSTSIASGATVTTVAGLTLTNPVLDEPILASPEERWAVSATAATGTINLDAKTSGILYYTTNASGNWTLNVRGDGSNTLNNTLAVNDSITVVFFVTNGATPYYQTGFQIDGSSVTPKWQNGTAPSAGNANSIDIYSFTIVKTANATFTVFGSQTKFA